MDKKSIESVKNFWENNPLFVGESKNEKGTKKTKTKQTIYPKSKKKKRSALQKR